MILCKLRDDVVYDISKNDRESKVSARTAISESLVTDPENMQNRGMKVVHAYLRPPAPIWKAKTTGEKHLKPRINLGQRLTSHKPLSLGERSRDCKTHRFKPSLEIHDFFRRREAGRYGAEKRRGTRPSKLRRCQQPRSVSNTRDRETPLFHQVGRTDFQNKLPPATSMTGSTRANRHASRTSPSFATPRKANLSKNKKAARST